MTITKERTGGRRASVEIFQAIWELAECGSLNWHTPQIARAAVPYLGEPGIVERNPPKEQFAVILDLSSFRNPLQDRHLAKVTLEPSDSTKVNSFL
jgi:hypothetical protein